MSCTICNHPKRQEIDQALLAGSASLNALCKEHGLSTSALTPPPGPPAGQGQPGQGSNPE